MILASLLPVAYGALLVVLLYRGDGLRAGVMRSFVVFGVTVEAVTELLSLFHAITPGALTATWAALVILAMVGCWQRSTVPRGGTFRWRRLAALLPFFGFAGLTLVVALAAPPNTWDAINYHMGRVLQWSQHGDVAFYQANVTRQLFLGPWAEYAILQFQVLSGTDRFANVVQWFAYCGCTTAASLIARELGAAKRGQWLAAAIVASLPMVVLQASSAQNDLVVSLWLAAFVWFGLQALETADARLRRSALAFAAVALALAVSTKGTALIIGGTLVLSGLARVACCWPRRRLVAAVVGVCLVVGLVNAPLWFRNSRLYSAPLGQPSTMRMVRAQRSGTRALVSNLTKNVALHLGTPWPTANHGVEAAVRGVHWLLGIDVNDPGLTWSDPTVPNLDFHVPPLNRDEDHAGNLLGLLLISGAVVLWTIRRMQLRVAGYGVACALSAMAFAILLRWQPWHSRLHTPLFVLGASWAGAIYSAGISRRQILLLGSFALLAGLPWAVSAHRRPLIPLAGDPASVLDSPRSSQYFVTHAELRAPFQGAASVIAKSGCRDVGFMGTEASWEYALWALLRSQGISARVTPINVANRSRHIPARLRRPPCVIVAQDIPDRRWPDARQWRAAWRSGDIVVFRRMQ